MKLPNNIQQRHLLQAIDRIDQEGIPKGAQSKFYDVVYNGKKYPPKLIVSYANFYANKRDLDRGSFEGGDGTPCFKLLQNFSFEIRPKEFFLILLNFLEQTHSNTVNLRVSAYPKKYQGLDMKVSFGKGNRAEIPWIAFLKDKQTVSKGIYPVYLYFREYKILILAYGISETKEPEYDWGVNLSTVNQLIEGKYFKEAKRYGNSLVCSYYEIDLHDESFGLSPKNVNNDLTKLLSFYKKLELSTFPEDKMHNNYIPFAWEAFKSAIDSTNLRYSDSLMVRFIASLATKPFVILTGLSGSGKTKLAQSFVRWLCESSHQYIILPVASDWTNREPLLGYPNALNSEEYVKPDNGVLDLLMSANRNSNLPFFLILDEMNLSHVERYFADFLSALESGEEIPLCSETKLKHGVPARIKLPPNLYIIGTVNIDETTYMFSPKVLDRANTIEFKVSKEEMKDFLTDVKEIRMGQLDGKGATMAKGFLELSQQEELTDSGQQNVISTLACFFGELQKVGAEFGYRSATEVFRLLHQLTRLNPKMRLDEKLDIAIIQKLLPKLHGSRRKLCPILSSIASFCIKGDIRIEKDVFEKEDFNFSDPRVLYPLSLEKIRRMYNSAIDNGFASFSEA